MLFAPGLLAGRYTVASPETRRQTHPRVAIDIASLAVTTK